MIVADTHALVWWFLSPQELSRSARRTLDENQIGVAAISCYEIVRLVERKRIDLDQETGSWLRSIFLLPQLQFLPLTMEVAALAGSLPDTLRDPLDRLIVATAFVHHAPLVTKDGKIAASNLVPTVW